MFLVKNTENIKENLGKSKLSYMMVLTLEHLHWNLFVYFCVSSSFLSFLSFFQNFCTGSRLVFPHKDLAAFYIHASSYDNCIVNGNGKFSHNQYLGKDTYCHLF